jgi:hypothetical protein
MNGKKSDSLLVSLVHDKAQALKQQLEWLQQLEADLTAVSHGESLTAVSLRQAIDGNGRPRNRGNLRDIVTQVLASAPDFKLKRADIIKAVQERIPGTLPIGVVSTLATKSLFRKLDGGESFQLRKPPQPEKA